MIIVVNAERIGEMGVLAPELHSLAVHQIDKGLQFSLAYIIRQHHRGVMTRREHHRVKERFDRHRLADIPVDARA